MKTIERLRTYKPSEGPWRYEPIYWALRMAEKGGNTHVPEDLPEDAKYPAREDSEYIAAVCNALPALLAVVEAADELRSVVEADHVEPFECSRGRFDDLIAALRALEGGE